jgi:hypothetical protein
MDSMKDVYFAMTEQDIVKEAEAYASEQFGTDMSNVDGELVKQAQDYDHIGRILAHQVLGDLVKEAMDEEMPAASEEKKKEEAAKLMAKARGESKGEDEEEDEEDEDTEKKASIQAAILERMGQDPDYVSHLVSKYYPG